MTRLNFIFCLIALTLMAGCSGGTKKSTAENTGPSTDPSVSADPFTTVSPLSKSENFINRGKLNSLPSSR